MPTINQLVSQWRKWINRSKSFDGKELDELENHLLEEIDYLTEKDGLSEDEAFTKAVIEMGKRENLDQEFTKVRGYVRPLSWIQKNSISMILILLMIVTFLIADGIYASNHVIVKRLQLYDTTVPNEEIPKNLYLLGTKKDPMLIGPIYISIGKEINHPLDRSTSTTFFMGAPFIKDQFILDTNLSFIYSMDDAKDYYLFTPERKRIEEAIIDILGSHSILLSNQNDYSLVSIRPAKSIDGKKEEMILQISTIIFSGKPIHLWDVLFQHL
jgi:hypothetical protein